MFRSVPVLTSVILLSVSVSHTHGDDRAAQIQKTGFEVGTSPLGHWGTKPEKYSDWKTHSNRLIPVYPYGTGAAGDGIDLNSYTGGNYHYVEVDFGSYYTHPSLNQRTLDLYYYIPQCLLNGKSILRCTISSNKIKMEFQQSIANGERFSVKLTIINPKNQMD